MCINHVSERVSSFTHIEFVTFSTCDKVYHVTDFTSFASWGVCQRVNSMCDFTLDLGDGCY